LQRNEIWNEITTAFESKFGYEITTAFESKFGLLGKQFAENMLISTCSWNIQQYSAPEYRIRRHTLLFWQAGFLKSQMLSKTYDILGDQLCTIMSDVSIATLRGSVEAHRFVSPYTLKRPFSICTEFGQLISGDQEVIQKLLNVLEEGIVTVSLAKISQLDPGQVDEVEKKYGITFIDNTTFTYRTNWVLFAATYNNKFLVDSALESRFALMLPKKKLDNELVKHVNRAPPFALSQEAVDSLRFEVLMDKPIETMIKLPDECYEFPITMRDAGMICSTLLCKKWWGLKPTKEEAVALAQEYSKNSDEIWKSAEDKVLDVLLSGGGRSVDELVGETGLHIRTVYKALNNLRTVKDISTNSKGEEVIVHKLK